MRVQVHVASISQASAAVPQARRLHLCSDTARRRTCKGLLVGLWVVQIAGGDVGAPDADLSHLAYRHLAALLIQDRDLRLRSVGVVSVWVGGWVGGGGGPPPPGGWVRVGVRVCGCRRHERNVALSLPSHRTPGNLTLTAPCALPTVPGL